MGPKQKTWQLRLRHLLVWLSLLLAGFSFCSNRVPLFSGSCFFNAGITDQCHLSSFLLLAVTENRVFSVSVGLRFTFSALSSGHRVQSIKNSALLIPWISATGSGKERTDFVFILLSTNIVCFY